MKILWVNSGLGRTISNTRLYGMPPALQKLGDQSVVLIAGKGTNLPLYFQSLPLLFGRLGGYRFLLALILPYLVWKHRPDVIITDWMSARLTRFIVIFKRWGWVRCKLVHDVRTVPVKDDGGKADRVYTESLQFAQCHFDGVTTITKPLREEIVRQFSLCSEKIAVWTSGVDVNHFYPREASELRRELHLEGKFVLFYHGSVNQNRGVLELAAAMQPLRDLTDLRLVILGGGNEWSKLEQLVREQGLDSVMLKPSVLYDQIPYWIALADLCIVPLPDHPWWRVSSPLKLMEYLAMGKPILLTEMQAHRAVIPEDHHAFYVYGCDPQVFAEGIRYALSQSERFSELAAWGRQKAIAELTWEHQAAILHDYLIRVMKGEIILRESSP